MHFIVIAKENADQGNSPSRTPSSTLGSLYSFRQLANFANLSVRQPPYCQQLTIGNEIALPELGLLIPVPRESRC
jgi:hypothetical protein